MTGPENAPIPEQAPQAAPPEDKRQAPLSSAKKTALLRYMAILFAVAFLLVLASLILQKSSSQEQIGALSESNASALTKAEQLQTQNRALQDEAAQLQTALDDAQAQLTEQADELEALREEYDALEREADAVQDAYAALITALQCKTHEGNVTYSKAMDTVARNKKYLSDDALAAYEALLASDEKPEQSEAKP